MKDDKEMWCAVIAVLALISAGLLALVIIANITSGLPLSQWVWPLVLR